MSKKLKIFCYKLNKPVAKELKKNLGVSDRIEYEKGFIKENLGNIYLFVTEKLKKGDEIALSNDYKFSFAGTLYKKINYIPEENEVFSSIGTFLVMPSKSFLSTLDPENKYLEIVVLDKIVDKIFTEEGILEEPKILNEEPVISQVTIEEQEPVVSTDPLDGGSTLVLSPENMEELLNASPVIPTRSPAENSDDEWWFDEEVQYCQNSIIDELEEKEEKIEKLEKENYRLSKKINSTIEEIKKLSFLDIILFRWKTKLLDILNL